MTGTGVAEMDPEARRAARATRDAAARASDGPPGDDCPPVAPREDMRLLVGAVARFAASFETALRQLEPGLTLSQLAALPVETEGSMTGYDRDEFDHWITRDGCTTRETVLARDGDDVTVGSDCYPDSGSWFSEYDGQTLSEAPDLDIDHVVSVAATVGSI